MMLMLTLFAGVNKRCMDGCVATQSHSSLPYEGRQPASVCFVCQCIVHDCVWLSDSSHTRMHCVCCPHKKHTGSVQ